MTNVTTEPSHSPETALQAVTPGITIGALKALIARLRRGNPKVSYANIGAAFGVNRGIIWKLHKRPGYVPSKRIRAMMRIAEPPRPRLVAQVPEDWKLAVQEAALAEGITVAEWLRDAIARELQLEE